MRYTRQRWKAMTDAQTAALLQSGCVAGSEIVVHALDEDVPLNPAERTKGVKALTTSRRPMLWPEIRKRNPTPSIRSARTY